MTGIVTNNFRLFNAGQLWDQFQPATSDDSIYFFIARNVAWTDESSPPTPSDTVQATDYDIWRNMIGMKKLTAGTVTYAAPRVDWTSNTAYAMYADNSTTFWANNFYVLTSDYNVYKCLYNNNGATSTSKPTGTSNSAIITADKYMWKFMYSVNAPHALTFLTSAYMPVQTLAADDGTTQWAVQQSAANGSVEVVTVTAGGTLYGGANGSFVSANASYAVLDSAASGASGYYNGSAIYVSGGPGAGQIRNITGWNLSTHTAQVNTAWVTNPTAASSYVLGPRVASTGDGTGFQAYAGVSGGAINRVFVINRGTKYSTITVTATGNTGSGASLHGHLSPHGGHGSDAVWELNARNLVLSVTLDGSESGTLMTDNDFRIIGLLANPRILAGTIANSSVYDQTVHMNIGAITGTFQKDESLRGGTSGANASIVSANTSMFRLTNINGTFTAGETVTGLTSNAFTTVSGTPSLAPLKLFTGSSLYIENRGAISRSATQKELVKIVIRF